MKILIVDDDVTSVKLMHVVLEEAGFNVSTAHDPENALKAVTRHRPRLILMDLLLPGIDGVLLTHLLKLNAETSHIPVIGMTAYTERFTMKQAIDAGCAAYIEKPIDTRAIVKLVDTHMWQLE